MAGWGKDDIKGDFQPIQHKVDVPIYDRSRCGEALRGALQRQGSRGANSFRLHPSELCAGGEPGKDACDGDGGAPLVCQAKEGNWYVEGLVTWGVNCADTNVPGVYLRVAQFTNWINNCPRYSRRGEHDYSQCARAL